MGSIDTFEVAGVHVVFRLRHERWIDVLQRLPVDCLEEGHSLHLLRGWPDRRVHCQQLLDRLHGLARQCLVVLRPFDILSNRSTVSHCLVQSSNLQLTSAENVLEDLLRRFVIEGGNAGHEFVQADAQSPPIHFGAVLVPADTKEVTPRRLAKSDKPYESRSSGLR